MQFIEIGRSKSFEMVTQSGLKIWDKLSAKLNIAPEENPKDGYAMMDALIEEVHKGTVHKISFQDDAELPEEQVEKQPLNSMIEAITTCTEVATLKDFAMLAKSKPEFQKAYDDTMERLVSENLGYIKK
jgi:restriction endonuclease Mrr